MHYEHAAKNLDDGMIYPMTKEAALATIEAHDNFIMLVRSVSDWREVH